MVPTKVYEQQCAPSRAVQNKLKSLFSACAFLFFPFLLYQQLPTKFTMATLQKARGRMYERKNKSKIRIAPNPDLLNGG